MTDWPELSTDEFFRRWQEETDRKRDEHEAAERERIAGLCFDDLVIETLLELSDPCRSQYRLNRLRVRLRELRGWPTTS